MMLRWLGLLVATPVVFYSARPFFAGALRSLKAGIAGMDVPVAIAIAMIYAASLVETVRGVGDVYFDSVSMFVFVLLIGRYLEMRARHHAGDRCDALARLSPQFADRIRVDGSHERVAATALVAGDSVHVGEGCIVPADGRLADGRCRVDEAMLSGESAGIFKRAGDKLIAGSLLIEGSARMTVETVGPNTLLAGIVTLAGRALTERPRLALAGERAAARFVVRIIVLAVITAVGWTIVDPARAFAATLSVLVVSCPCAFALAVPAAMTAAFAALARTGVLIVRPDALEKLAAATHVVFDKTGTLTQPGLSLTRVDCLRGENGDAALAIAGALARGNRQPLSQEIVRAAAATPIVRAESLSARTGAGIEGVVDGRAWRLGRADYALDTECVDDALADAVVLARENEPVAAFHFTECIRPDAAAAVASLAAEGLDVEIVSGDAPSKVSDIAARLCVSRWTARTDPAGKLARLKELRREGARIVMVGDGINDAPGLAGADVGVSFAAATDLAQASSDIILAGSALLPLCRARAIALRTLGILEQNQRWALVYNACVIPLAALGFIPPWLAAAGMSASSLAVVLNALRIGREPVTRAAFPHAATLAKA
jgi:Cu2+-exporting ATPase